MDTLKEARKELLIKGKAGTNCPCCGQYVKLYKRKLNSGMSVFLIGLYKLTKESSNKTVFSNKEIMSRMKINTASLDYSVLKHFGLIEEPLPMALTIGAKRKSGLWKLTVKGDYFVENNITVPSHVFLYNNKVKGFSNTQTTLPESLGKKFNYKQLMTQ